MAATTHCFGLGRMGADTPAVLLFGVPVFVVPRNLRMLHPRNPVNLFFQKELLGDASHMAPYMPPAYFTRHWGGASGEARVQGCSVI